MITAPPILQACLAGNSHYLDITGEIDVFERIFALDAQARQREREALLEKHRHRLEFIVSKNRNGRPGVVDAFVNSFALSPLVSCRPQGPSFCGSPKSLVLTHSAGSSNLKWAKTARGKAVSPTTRAIGRNTMFYIRRLFFPHSNAFFTSPGTRECWPQPPR